MSDQEKLRETVAYYDKMEGHDAWSLHLRRLIEHARRSLPKTKMVEVWQVEFVRMGSGGKWLPDCTRCGHASGYFTRAQADDEAMKLDMDAPEEYRCIRVTGPHQQEVPSE